MSSIFGGNATQNPSTGTGGLFGGNFGNLQNQGSSLFGGSAPQNQPSGTGGLFGGNAPNQQNQGSSLFAGNTAAQNQPRRNSVFGGNVMAQNQPQGTGLFGSNAPTQNQPPGTGLFGSTQPPPNQPTSLFSGNTAANPPPNAQASTLFNPTQQQTTTPSLFQPSASQMNTQPQQTHLSTLLQSGLGSTTTAFGALGTASQHDLARSRLAAANINPAPAGEKSVYAQIQTLIRKWDPNSQDTLMRGYVYNAVNSAYAPFYYRNADEDEASWEEALAHKPDPLSGEGGVGGEAGENISFVPVLVRGFHALGERVEYQARTVNEMRARLHEMNNSLDAVMARHQQSLTVRVENARRQHAALRQRCLRLAVKVQVLRHRNYPLDAAEEGLRRTLLELEKGVFDPQFQAREEEVWARMVALRERARWLEEEGRRVGGHVEEQRRDGAGTGVSEEVLQRTRRILRDYDGELALLARELEEVKREFEGWEGGRGR